MHRAEQEGQAVSHRLFS